MKRREFVKNSLLAGSGILMIDSVLGCMDPSLKDPDLDSIFQGFQNPPSEARLFVRWWWNGNRLEKNEILRELDVMKAAGIGGVEINPIAFPGNADPMGYKPLTIFTDEWLDMLEVALTGAKQRGMICDMIVGSGWPFGGEFLKKEEQTQMVTIETIDLQGGQAYKLDIPELLEKVDPKIHSKHEKVYKDLLMIRLLPKESEEFTEGVDLIETMANNELTVEVPRGEHVLYYVVKLTGYMAVINGSPGAAGPVLNHYSKEATEAYLNRVSDFLISRIGDLGQYIRAMFCDSMELEGANWNDDLPAEFAKRRGYSLWPFLPLVLKKVGHMGNPIEEDYGTRFSAKVRERLKRVDLDLYQTRIELFKERFIDTFNDWCHKNNVQSRMQAYGRGMHPLEASMEIDIPECETWLFKEVGIEYLDTGLNGRAPRMCNKYVASGANLAGKKIVSCEEITNTAMAFMATLEHIKIAGDQSNLSGVNHSILHGFNYSPPEAPLPGWIRYGTYFNEKNPWWPYFKKWSDYKARISYLLQVAKPMANIGILQPLTDLWLKFGPQRDPFPHKWYPDYQNNLWEVIHQNGGGCDYISESIIKSAEFKKGELRYNDRSYDTLLLPEIETLDLETVQSLEIFAKSGGNIVFIGKSPFKSASYSGGKKTDQAVRQKIGELLQLENVLVTASPNGDLLKWYRKLQEEIGCEPYLKFDRTHPYLSQSSYELGGQRLHFIANTSLSDHISIGAEFNPDKKYHPWIWNPETGEKALYPRIDQKKIQLELPAATSVLIVLESAGQGEVYNPIEVTDGGLQIKGEWKLKLNHVNGEKKELILDELTDLIDLEAARDFAGEIIYEKNIEVTASNYLKINLGKVKGVSELIVNGKHLGVKWYGAHLYAMDGGIKGGENKIQIKVTTILGNYLKSLKDNPVAMAWTRHQEYYSMGVLGPVTLH